MERKHHINSAINADERMQLNEEIDLIYGGITKNAINHRDLVDDFNKFLERYGMDKVALEKMILDGDTNVLNVVEKMITDFLVSKPSNFDEVTAARLGEKTLRDFNQKMKVKLDNTDKFQQVKLTNDTGIGIRIKDINEIVGKCGFFTYSIYGDGIKGQPQGSKVGCIIANSFSSIEHTVMLAIDSETGKMYRQTVHKGSISNKWETFTFEGAYDDIKNEVNKVKGAHTSLDTAIRALIPYNSVNYYGNDNAAFQKALDESEGKTLDIPAGKYTIGDLNIPSNISIRADPNAIFILKAGSTTFFNNKDTVNIGGYDKTRSITFKGGLFDLKKVKDAKAFVLSHCQDVKVDTKVINGGESQSYVVLNAVKDTEIHIEALDCNATTSIGAIVGLYVFNDKNTLTNQNTKPYDLTPCDGIKVNLKLKNVKKGFVEIAVIDKVIHKNITYNVQAENVSEEVGLFNNVSYFRTERVFANDIGNGLIFQILNDSCEDFTLEGINIRNGKNKESSRGVWFKSKEGDNAPQYQQVRILNPVIKTMNAGIVTDYGYGVRITNPDVSYCQEDGIWCYFTLDWSCIGGVVKYNNQRGWPRADIHIGEGGGKKTFRAILANCQARTVWLTGIQDSIVTNVIVKGGGFTYNENDFNNKIDYLEVGW
ncbi:hypothetical protein DN392_12740 [Bacillus sp. BB51/4]|uniref:hypothetical protein n=1 Tax=Bacillus sp. BB51/4 TaxID=2217819 RepID=UPI0011ECDC75|nr:hypothetical protein [Bacillus sp. BB51/4]KAA0775812.1 hypothetical protein DN392_12740 [Bacillus sp. BB51/4]